MVLALVILILIFLFILSFLGGYILGKDKIILPRKLTEKEKEEMKVNEKKFNTMMNKYNEAIDQVAGFGDINGL